MGIRRFSPRARLWLVSAVASLSFLVSVIGVFHNREAAFYLAHTRAWELLLGTLIAMDLFTRISALWRNVAAFSGLALIFCAGYFFSAATPFPGAAALSPCLGAALIIAAGRSGPSLVGQCLSFTPLVFVGMISYSLYLWHWPMIVFQGMGGLLIQGVSPKTAKLAVMATRTRHHATRCPLHLLLQAPLPGVSLSRIRRRRHSPPVRLRPPHRRWGSVLMATRIRATGALN